MVDSKPTLYALKHSSNLLTIQALAKFSNFDMNVKTVPNTITPPLTVDDSPTNSYPYLVTSEGTVSETSAILNYIGSRTGLSGSNDYERAQVLQWMAFASLEISSGKMNTVYPLFGFFPYDQEKGKEGLDRLKNHLKSLDKHLKGREYLVGKSVSVADLYLWTALKHLFQLIYVDNVRKNVFPNVTVWFERVSNLECVLKTFGPTQLCKVPVKYPKCEKKKEEVKKEEKKEEVKKEEKKEEKPKEPEYPNLKLVFDDFKKDFSNNDKEKALDLLFTQVKDEVPGALTFCYVRYQKLKTEGKELWKTENSRDMLCQYMDPHRKMAFGNLGVYGTEGDYEVKGCFAWRGEGVPQYFVDIASFEFYDKEFIDPSTEEGRNRLKAYWLNTSPGNVVENLPVCNTIWFK